METFFISHTINLGPENTTNHLGHHNHILLFQEARNAYLNKFGYIESNIEGFQSFVVEVHCKYLAELVQGDEIKIHCRMTDILPKLFFMEYFIKRGEQVCAQGSTRSICIDPETRRSALLPEKFVSSLGKHAGNLKL